MNVRIFSSWKFSSHEKIYQIEQIICFSFFIMNSVFVNDIVQDSSNFILISVKKSMIFKIWLNELFSNLKVIVRWFVSCDLCD